MLDWDGDHHPSVIASGPSAAATTSFAGTPEAAVDLSESELKAAGHEGPQIGEAEQHQGNTC